MQIIDNFLPEEYYKKILDETDSMYFPWYYHNYSSTTEDGVPQFVHTFYQDGEINSTMYGLVEPIIKAFEEKTNFIIKEVYRVKANLITNAPVKAENIKRAIHQDLIMPNYVSLLYYVHDSDGDTILYQDDKETEAMRVKPVANRVFILLSNKWHNATPPKDHTTRKVINCVFKI